MYYVPCSGTIGQCCPAQSRPHSLLSMRTIIRSLQRCFKCCLYTLRRCSELLTVRASPLPPPPPPHPFGINSYCAVLPTIIQKLWRHWSPGDNPGGAERPNNGSRGFILLRRFRPSGDSNAARTAFARAVTGMAGSGASLRSFYKVRRELSSNRFPVVRESISAVKTRA